MLIDAMILASSIDTAREQPVMMQTINCANTNNYWTFYLQYSCYCQDIKNVAQWRSFF